MTQKRDQEEVVIPGTGDSSVSGHQVMDRAWERVQQRTFTRWCQSHLVKVGLKVENVQTDFCDGINLIGLMEAISGKKVPGKPVPKPRMKIQKVQNVLLALDFIQREGIRLLGIGAEDISGEDGKTGNLKLILGMIWTIILRYQIADISEGELSAKEALLLWAKKKTRGYRDTDVQNLTDSWNDGMAFCALIHKHRPDLIDFDKLDKKNALENLQLAFDVAERSLGIPQLLDAVDTAVEKPDERSIITYLSLYYHAFANMGSQAEAADVLSRMVDLASQLKKLQDDYEYKAAAFKQWMEAKDGYMLDRTWDGSASHARAMLNELEADYRREEKPAKAADKEELSNIFSTLQLKLKNSGRQPYEPPTGLHPRDLDTEWTALGGDEADREAWLRDCLNKAQQLENLSGRYGKKADALEKWINEKQGFLEAEESVNSIGDAQNKLRTAEAFGSEYDDSKPRLKQVQDLAREISELGGDADGAFRDRTERITQSHDGLNPLWETKLEKLRRLLAEEEEKERLRKEFADKAKAYQAWCKQTNNELLDRDFGQTLAEVERAEKKVSSKEGDTRAANSAKLAELDQLWEQLEALGAAENNRHTPLTKEDVHRLGDTVEHSLVDRRAAYDEELARQREMEELRKRFAALADVFVGSIEERKALIRALEGEPEDLAPQVTDAYADGAPELQQIDGLRDVSVQLSKLGVTSNPYTKFSLADLMVSHKGFARYIKDYLAYLEEEAALRNEYKQRAAAQNAWVESTLPTLQTREFDNTLAGALETQRAWHQYKVGESASHEFELDGISGLKERIDKIGQQNGRPVWVPPEGLDLQSLQASWEQLQAAEQERDAAITEEVARQETIELLVRRFNNEADEVQMWLQETESFLGDEHDASSLKSVRLASANLQVTQRAIASKAARVDGLQALHAELEPLGASQWNEVDARFQDISTRFAAVKKQSEEIRVKLDEQLTEQAEQEHKRSEWAIDARALQKYVDTSVETINDYNFGSNFDAVQAAGAALDENDALFRSKLAARREALAANVVPGENPYTDLTEMELDALADKLEQALQARREAHAAELEVRGSEDERRKTFAANAEQFIAWIEAKRAQFDALEGEPDARIAAARDLWEEGAPNASLVSNLAQEQDALEADGIHGNKYVKYSLPVCQQRSAQFDNAVRNLLEGLEQDQALAVKEAAMAAAQQEQDERLALELEYSTAARQLDVWVATATDDLTEHIFGDIPALQAKHAAWQEKELPPQLAALEALRALNDQLQGQTNFAQVEERLNGVCQLAEERTEVLKAEAEYAASKDEASTAFAAAAVPMDTWLESQKNALESTSGGELETQLQAVGALSKTVETEGAPLLAAVREADERQNSAGVLVNPQTQLTLAELTVRYEALQKAVKKRAEIVNGDLLRKQGSTISSEQVNDYREAFDHFDKQRTGTLDRLGFTSVLQALGDAMEEAQVAEAMTAIDTDGDGRITFVELVGFLASRVKKSDSKSDIIDSFQALAGGKEYITPADLTTQLPADKAAFLIANMPPHASGLGLDYVAYANTVF